MKKEKEYIDAEIVNENSKEKNTGSSFATDQINNQIKDIKKALLIKGGFFIAFWATIFILILTAIVSLIFWLLPFIFAFIIAVIILGFLFNLSYKIYSFFK